MIRECLYNWFACDREFFLPPKEVLLTRMLVHAAETVPYYRSLFAECGVYDQGALRMDSFASLPILERTVLYNSPGLLQSSQAALRWTYWNTSGGSTGEPCTFLQDKTYLRRSRVVTLAQKKRWGYCFGDPLIKVWGDEREALQQKRFSSRSLSARLKNEYVFNAFQFDDATKRAVVEALAKQQHVLLVGYVQALFELARFIEAEKLEVQPPRAIIASAGVCYPLLRETIERVLQCKLADRYGSREVGNIACETPDLNGLLVAPSVYVEVETASGISQNGTGDLLITSLINDVMPLIRYRIGDRGTLRTNNPEQQFISAIEGRSVDMFHSASGSLVDGEFFTHLLYGVAAVRKFQVIQKTVGSVEFLIESDTPLEQQQEEHIKAQVRTVMGADCETCFSYTTKLAPHPSGKHRYTISEVR